MIEELRALDTRQLQDLAAALRSGRLTLAASEMGLSVAIGDRSSAGRSVLAWFGAHGLSAVQTADLLDLVAADRSAGAVPMAEVQLVSTGPESPDLPSRDTRVVVRGLFAAAQRSVVVAGYAVYQGREVFSTLAERMDNSPDLDVAMFLDVQRAPRDTSTAADILTRFAHRFRTREWPGSRMPNVYYDPRSLDMEPGQRTSLHAKCVVVDDNEAFISSANFTRAAQLRNIEIGVLLRMPDLARRLAGHFRGLVSRGELLRLPEL